MWLDIITGTIFIIALLQGYKNGLIRAIISFFSLFIGVLVAFQLAGWVANQLREHTKMVSNWIPFISFLLVLIVVLIILKWISRFLQQTAEWFLLGWLNKLLGIVLYSFIYMTLFSAVVYFLKVLGVIEVDKMKGSYSYAYLNSWWPYCLNKISTFLPAIKNTIATFTHPLK